MNKIRRAGARLCLGIVLGAQALASPAGAGPHYAVQRWEAGATEEGLPQNTVTAAAQTRDGYLWLGTRGSLVRFDGVRFHVFDGSNSPNSGSPHVTCLFEAADGALWIGHEDGTVTCYRAGKFAAVPVRAAWHGGKIFAIGADRSGEIWLANAEGELARVPDGLMIAAPPTNVTHFLSLANNPGGGFWIQRGNEVASMEAGQLKVLPFIESATTPYIQGIGASRDGGLWVMMDARIRKWNNGRWTDDWGDAPWLYAGVAALIETQSGDLVAGTADHGLYLVSGGTNVLQFCRSNNFPSDWITALCEDREGNLWAGTGNNGLARLRPKNPVVITPPDQWQGRAVLSVTTSADDALWIGTEGGSLYSYRAGDWTNYSTEAGLTSFYVWSVVQDVAGTMWAGTWSGSLFRRSGARFELAQGLERFFTPIPALLATADRGLLVGSGSGLLRYESNQVTWLARKPELSTPDVRAIAQAADGTIWFGMSGGGLGCLKEGKLRQFRRPDGLASDYVQCLHLETNGTLWIGTFNGLNRLQDGRFTIVTKKHGLPNDVICAVQDDGLGNFWISTRGGIARVNQTELHRCADGQSDKIHCLTYGLSDGLPSLECSGGFQPASCRTADGRLWFPTSKGLVGVAPQNVQTNMLPPPVIIERLLVDDVVVAESPDFAPAVSIGPGQHRFEFQFTGLSFAAPEKVRFKYRLDGLDKDWVEVQSPRRAYYSRIPPGEYRFQVQASNNDGIWNETGAQLEFQVRPFFWQTWWFRLVAGGLLLAGATGIAWYETRRRMQLKLEQLERQRAVEHERARIAKDIHDDLGAGLTRISLLSGSLTGAEATASQTHELLGRIFATTNEMTQAMDEIVWAVNPQHDTLDSLAGYLGKFTQDYLESGGVRCRLDLPVHLPHWRLDAEVRHNLFLAFKESLNNVLRHAGATEVLVSLALGTNGFTLRVQDNGTGFTTAAAPHRVSHGNGLTNMQQRLGDIGGRCEINSVPGQGTRVEFYVVRQRGEL